MSAFLGPVHTWLHKKINIQDEFTNKIINSLDDENKTEINKSLNDSFGSLPEGELADIIDTSNIHGWLQEKVKLVESRYVYAVKYILDNKLADIKQLKNIASDFGKSLSADYKVSTAEECFKLLSDVALDGMPCDHINSVSSQSDNSLVYERKDSFRDELWQKQNLDSNIYYQLRVAFINGILAYTPYRLKIIDNNTFCFYSDSITLMMSEHQYILRMVKVIRKACYGIMNGEKVDYDDLADMILFIRNYADNHHHGKEEKILFKQMTEHLGQIGDNLIRHGMLVEHDLGRLFMKEFEDAIECYKKGDDVARLDIIANAISYTHLICRHIEKEDDLIYTYGQKNLSEDIMDKVNSDTMAFEMSATQNGVQKKYIELLVRLENKYVGK